MYINAFHHNVYILYNNFYTFSYYSYVSVKIFSIFFSSSPVIPFLIVSNLQLNICWVLNVSYCIFHLIILIDFIPLIKFYIKCFHGHVDQQYFRVKRIVNSLGIGLHLWSVTSLVGSHFFLYPNMPGKFLI